jgi:uncharacterized protein YhaN
LRFERLSIPAFGPFTDVAFDFPATGADLHLVYGANEAGKSSLLRAIRDLLYGIPGQTPDRFVHDYAALRIGATLCRRDGQRLAVQRRKGNRNTLLDAAGEPLPDDALAPFLGAVDREYFTTMFGLGAAELRQGAADLLQGRGDLGQALFSASLAGTPVHRILEALDAEARRLFDGRARVNVTIRPALDDYDEHLRASREATVKPETWEAAVLALETATGERDGLDAELAGLRARADWVGRCLDALPAVGRLQAAAERLSALPPCPTVEAGFVTEAETALERLAAAEAARAGARTRVERLDEQLSRLAVRQDVLDRAGEIEAAHQDLPIDRRRREELAAAENQRAAAQARLRATLRRLGLGDDAADGAALRSTLPDDLAVKAAAGDLVAADDALAALDEEAGRLQRESDREEAKLAQLPDLDVAALRSALAETEAAAAAARALATDEAALAAAEQAMSRALARLTGAPADAAAAYALPVPLMATLRGFEERERGIATRREAAVKDGDAAAATLRDVAVETRGLEQRGAIPTLEGLATARARRDATWAQVLAAWTERRDGEPVDGVPLAQAYPRTVQAADAIADGLRDDAARVAAAWELAQRRAKAENDAADAAARLARADAERGAWHTDWQAAWQPCGIAPGTVAEMLEWRDLWTAFREAHERWVDARDRVTRARAAIDGAAARLEGLIGEAASTALLALREAVEQQVRAADEAQGERRTLAARRVEIEARRAQLRAERPALADAAARARDAWRACCATLGAAADTSPAAGLELLALREQAVAEHDALAVLAARCSELADAVGQYAKDVGALADALAVIPGSVEVRESLAWGLLQTARADAARCAQLAQQLDAERGLLADAEAEAARAEAEIARLTVVAGVASREELQTLLHRLAERADAETAVLTHRDALQGAARGEPLDAFIARVQAEDRDGLAAEQAALAEQIEALVKRRDEQVKEVSRLEQERQQLERASAAAAEHLQAARHAAVRIRHDAARYLRLRLATAFLREQIEQFRRQNQGPLLRRAGEIFTAITRGSFEGLGTGFGDDDTPVLVGIRNGAAVGVEGMSEGTCDQLYLALRLAAIEQHAAGHEPMPVILDDLLVTFDDERASAVLPILRDLGTRGQVLLFTHHRHLVELAKAALPEGAVHYHELAGRV